MFIFIVQGWNILLRVVKKTPTMLANIVQICFRETAVKENNGTNTGFTYQYEIYGIWPSPFVHFATLCMPSFPAYPQQLCAETMPEWWGPHWTALKWPHFSNQQHAAPKTSCNNWEKSVMGTSSYTRWNTQGLFHFLLLSFSILRSRNCCFFLSASSGRPACEWWPPQRLRAVGRSLSVWQLWCPL